MKRKVEELDSYSEFPRKRTFYDPDPDYTRPLYDLPPETRERMAGRLRFLYGERFAEQYMPELERILRVHHAHKPPEMIEKEKAGNFKQQQSQKNADYPDRSQDKAPE